jgi:hypothetical protein
VKRRLKVLFHAHCFDGASSAALFSRFYAEKIDGDAEIVFAGKVHARGPVFGDGDFDADDHAVVDFRYSADARLGWWIDHHLSAFSQSGDEDDFRARPGDRFFYDPQARSCTKFLVESLERTYGWDWRRHAELVRWAHLIDAAQYDNARQAVELTEPALQLTAFLEHNQDPLSAIELIEALVTQPLPEIAARSFVQEALKPVVAQNIVAEAVLSARMQREHGVACFDVGDDGLDGYNKFLPYLLAPDCGYVVAVSAGPTRTKVSVGINPWNAPDPHANIARICERYGGGGHAVVGAVTLPAGVLPEARRIAAEIAGELRKLH